MDRFYGRSDVSRNIGNMIQSFILNANFFYLAVYIIFIRFDEVNILHLSLAKFQFQKNKNE